MELPKRAADDLYVPEGRYTQLVSELRQARTVLNWSTVIAYAFDDRTRLMPFRWLDQRVVPCGVRSIAASMRQAGFTRIRTVLQQWTRNFSPTATVASGTPIDILMVSTMGLHAAEAYQLIRDAHQLGADRPLIIVGGPKAIYEPEDLFQPNESIIGGGADVVVTGEQFVLLDLLRVLADHATEGGTPLSAFERARKSGALESVPGLVFRAPDADPSRPYLLNSGIQRLMGNLDELPMPLDGYLGLEAPHRGRTLRSKPLTLAQAGRKSLVSTLVVTHGCKFNCDFCPIPAYQQRTWRHKSPERVAAEMQQLGEGLGIRYFFGTDDNFFNNRASAESILTAMAGSKVHGRPFRDSVRFYTEATEFDVYKNRDLLPLCREAGLSTIFFGIEDLNARLINKGQTVNKTEDLFKAMRDHEVEPYAMMIHHDDQPFWSRNPEQLGVVNQALKLFDLGALGYHTTYISPSMGARNVETMYGSGEVFASIGGRKVPEAFHDGNHIIASRRSDVWVRQLQMLAAYLAFYNPLNFARTVFRDLRVKHNRRRITWQLIGQSMLPATIARVIPYAASLAFGKIVRHPGPPARALPMLDAQTGERLKWGIDSAAPYEVEHPPSGSRSADLLPVMSKPVEKMSQNSLPQASLLPVIPPERRAS